MNRFSKQMTRIAMVLFLAAIGAFSPLVDLSTNLSTNLGATLGVNSGFIISWSSGSSAGSAMAQTSSDDQANDEDDFDLFETELDNDLSLSDAGRVQGDQFYEDESDPFVNYNRSVSDFNLSILPNAVNVVESSWTDLVPNAFKNIVRSLLSTLDAPFIITHSLLQFDFDNVTNEIGRLVFNGSTTLFLYDFAADVGFEQQSQNFGDVLIFYGVPHGPYVTFPLAGASDLRNIIGVVAGGYFVDRHVNDALGWKFTDKTSFKVTEYLLSGFVRIEDNADALLAFEQTAFDPYIARRAVHYRLRQNRERPIIARRERLLSAITFGAYGHSGENSEGNSAEDSGLSQE